jgi:hypothetical protein
MFLAHRSTSRLVFALTAPKPNWWGKALLAWFLRAGAKTQRLTILWHGQVSKDGGHSGRRW